jgi:aminoglycoside phosphotransferase (APT) family kinase protein
MLSRRPIGHYRPVTSSATDDAVARRRRVLVAAGLDPHLPMTPVASYANEVWMGDELVVRINHPGLHGAAPDRLLREAAIAARLSPEVRYPPIVAVGSDPAEELAWIVTRVMPGVQLGRAWPTLAPVARRDAIQQLAEALAVLHATPLAGLPPLEQQPPHTLPLDEILALIDRLADDGYDRGLLGEVAAFACERWPALADAPRRLAHGDPHFENVLWDGARVSLLDLEWSQVACIECDLEILLAVAAHPALFAAVDYEASLHPADFVEVPRWLAAACPSWFAPARLEERLELLLVSRTLGCLDEAEPGALANDPGLALRIVHLRTVLDGTSYLRAQLASL